jgi:MerR family transcriptional regulator, multidrug-efflux activator
LVYTVKRVADLAGLSVRALHHYDEIGVLRPTSVSPAGYRLYADADLERLQQVLFFREIGFGLREIRDMIDSPTFDRRRALDEHRNLLREKRRQLDALIASVERTIEAVDHGTKLEGKAMFEGFDEKQMEQYREEARGRWGKEKVDESWRRAAKYSKADWSLISAETEAIESGIAARTDRDPTDPEVQSLVDRWFRLINDRYYDCSAEIFRGLGDLYVQDERFMVHYEKRKAGLAAFMRAAMHVYCDRLG